MAGSVAPQPSPTRVLAHAELWPCAEAKRITGVEKAPFQKLE
jgi:hypothetical protein